MTVSGVIVSTLRYGQFIVELETGEGIRAYTSGKLRRFHITVQNGDRVTVELSPYDLSRGRIVAREAEPPIAGAIAVR